MAKLKFVMRKSKVHKKHCTEKDKPRSERKACKCPEYKTDSKGNSAIYLRITGDSQVVFISTQVYVPPKRWNEKKQKIEKLDPNERIDNDLSSTLNRRLKDIYLKAENMNNNNASVQKIKDELTGKNKKSEKNEPGDANFVEYANSFIQSVKSEGQYWNGKNLNTALYKLIKFNGGDVIPFKTMTPEYIRNFKAHLHENGNKVNTVSKTLGSLKRIFNQAIADKKISRDSNPFLNVKLKKEKSNKEKLVDAEIDKIGNLELPEGSLIWHVRNYFMFSFFSGGMRFIDLVYLKWDNVNNGILTYTMSKTDKTLEFELLPPAVDILEHYEPVESGKFIFPILPEGIEDVDIETQKNILSAKNALINKYLVKIQERAGIWQKTIKEKDESTGEIKTKVINSPRLSMHISRHSFAFFAMRNGMNLFEIQAMLGHSSATITETYLKSLSPESISTALRTTFKKFYIPGDKKILEIAK